MHARPIVYKVAIVVLCSVFLSAAFGGPPSKPSHLTLTTEEVDGKWRPKARWKDNSTNELQFVFHQERLKPGTQNTWIHHKEPAYHCSAAEKSATGFREKVFKPDVFKGTQTFRYRVKALNNALGSSAFHPPDVNGKPSWIQVTVHNPQ
jgi:hypothetical protein